MLCVAGSMGSSWCVPFWSGHLMPVNEADGTQILSRPGCSGGSNI